MRRLLVTAVVLLLMIQSGLMLALEIGSVHAYQRVGRPITKRISQCRYQPSCSNYALAVLDEHGFWGGNLRLAQRLAMCSPLGWAIEKSRGEI